MSLSRIWLLRKPPGGGNGTQKVDKGCQPASKSPPLHNGRGYLPWIAAASSGILLSLCFPRWNQAWLCWLALAPLVAAIWSGNGTTPNLRRCAALGYLTGLIFFWGVFYWLTTVTGLGWFLLPFYLALFPAAWGAFLGLIRWIAGDFTHSGANLAAAFLGAAAWTALEWLRGLGALSFGWNGLGVALHGNLALIQITEYTGVGGLSFLTALTSLIAVATVRRFFNETQARKFRPHWDFNLCVALVAVVFAFGVRKVFTPPAPGSIPLKIAAVQANIPQEEKFDRSFETLIRQRYTRLTEMALATQPQLLLWPEAATPGALFESEDMLEYVRSFARHDGLNFLLGTLDFDANKHDYNVAALFTEKGEKLQFYRKIHLVPFGEYIPFRKSFPPFEWIIGDLVPGDFTPGTQYTLLKLKNPALNAGALICFEDTLGDLTRHFVKEGAQLLINVTNDGWFLHSAGSQQHLANALFRAVENRRPLIRAANTGVTAIIGPRGRILDTFRPGGTTFGEGVLTSIVQIPPQAAPTTFYTRHGECFSEACAALTLAGLALGLRHRRKP